MNPNLNRLDFNQVYLFSNQLGKTENQNGKAQKLNIWQQT